MRTIFNRREPLPSPQKLYPVREAPWRARGFEYTVRARAFRDAAGLRGDALYTYVIYVRRDDYERAAAIRPALRDRGGAV